MSMKNTLSHDRQACDSLLAISMYHGTADVLEWIAQYLGEKSEDYDDLMRIVNRNRSLTGIVSLSGNGGYE